MGEEQGSKDTLRLRNIKVLIAGWAVWSPVQAMLAPYQQLYQKELGATPTIISFLSASFSLTNSLAKLFGGYLTDKYGRKKILWIGTFFVSIGYLLYAFAPSWEWLFVANVVNGIALFYQPALRSIIADSTVTELRGRLYSLINLVPQLLSTVSPMGGAWAVKVFGLLKGMRLLYAAAMAAGLIVTFMRWRWLEETLTAPRGTTGIRGAYKEVLPLILGDYKNLFLLDVFTAVIDSFGILYSYYKFYYLGITEVELGILATISSGINLLIAYPIGYLVDRLGRGPLMKLSLVLRVFGSTAVALAPAKADITFPYIVGSEMLLVFSGTMYWGVIGPLTADIVDKEYRGRVLSLLDLITTITWTAGSIIAGMLYEKLEPRVPFMVQAFLSLLLLPVLWRLITALTLNVDSFLKMKKSKTTPSGTSSRSRDL